MVGLKVFTKNKKHSGSTLWAHLPENGQLIIYESNGELRIGTSLSKNQWDKPLFQIQQTNHRCILTPLTFNLKINGSPSVTPLVLLSGDRIETENSSIVFLNIYSSTKAYSSLSKKV